MIAGTFFKLNKCAIYWWGMGGSHPKQVSRPKKKNHYQQSWCGKSGLSYMAQMNHLFLLSVLHQPPLLNPSPLDWCQHSLRLSPSKSLHEKSHFSAQMEKTSFCFYTGPLTRTVNVKMVLALVHTHIPFFTWWKAKQDMCASPVCMSLPIPTTFFFIFFFLNFLTICIPVWLRRRNIKPIRKRRKTWPVKILTL